MPAEFDFIDWLRRRQPATPLVPTPAGDDLAVLAWPAGDLLLVGVDQVLDGVHFDLARHAARLVGRKAMNRNLSDCAAMGCLPAAAVLTLALPKGGATGVGGAAVGGDDLARDVYLGAEEAAAAFDCRIVGGDTGSWPGRLAVTVTVLGRSAGVRPVTRAGGRPGDGLWVTGPLGGSILGRHLTFAPRVATGRALAERGIARAMIDLSDGLSRDVRHLCREAGGLGALIDSAAVPIHPDAEILAARTGYRPIHHALHDGEDYELLAAVAPEAEPAAAELGLIRVGRLTAEPGVRLDKGDGRPPEPLEPLGWEHKL
ncbi:MAG TPA: thiamine-phosphate kinase [Humisphaera sp.]